MKDSTYSNLMMIGKVLSCHQRADRSFHFHGRQFPVCARCTGVYLGEFAALLTYRLIKPPIALSLIFCAIMLLDWALQFFKVLESTNRRRLITGLICGYGFGNLALRIILLVITM